VVDSPSSCFYFDLADPLSYLAAERILHMLPGPVEWRPVLARELGPVAYEGFRCRDEEEIFRADIARSAARLRLQPLRWPDPFPFDSTLAMLAATYAKSIGRAVPFAQAAFRQAFAGGRSLQQEDSVLIAAAACEMHPTAVLQALKLGSVAQQLAVSTQEAAAADVRELPAIVLGAELFAGATAVEEAANAI
jgi:2-hydroxychromene-2-carboxylate isomerase